MKKPVILLTATINPDGTANAKLQDQDLRKNQYVKAVDFYIKETDCNIVICENSAYPLHKDMKKYIGLSRFELISFHGNTYDKTMGKSFGEAEIILYAIHNSSLLKNETNFIKITGRIIIENIKEILKIYHKLPFSKRILIAELWGPQWVQSVCFVCNKNWIHDLLLMRSHALNDFKYNIHNLLYDGLVEEKDVKIRSIYPQINGISGKTGELYFNDYSIQRKIDNYAGLKEIYKLRKDWVSYIISYSMWFTSLILRKLG